MPEKKPIPRRRPPPKKPAVDPRLVFLEHVWPWIVRVAGMTIIFWETLVENADRPSLLLVAAGMIGLPEFVKIGLAKQQPQRSK